MDKGLNSLLKWSIENSAASQNEDENKPTTELSGLDAKTLASLMGGPSEADLMKEAMAVIRNSDASLEDRLTAFDNFEQLVENLDNANNLEPLGLWTPLVDQLHNEEGDMRRMAAWCLGTAVQNNVKAQERLLVVGGVPKIAELAVKDQSVAVRKKATYALSSEIRNYQPALDEALKHLPTDISSSKKIQADDMEAIDDVIAKLRDRCS